MHLYSLRYQLLIVVLLLHLPKTGSLNQKKVYSHLEIKV
jgi:hypothetical protein